MLKGGARGALKTFASVKGNESTRKRDQGSSGYTSQKIRGCPIGPAPPRGERRCRRSWRWPSRGVEKKALTRGRRGKRKVSWRGKSRKLCLSRRLEKKTVREKNIRDYSLQGKIQGKKHKKNVGRRKLKKT